MDKSDVRRALFMLVGMLAVLTMILAACAAPTPQPQVAPTGPATSPTAAQAPPEVKRITLEESKAAFDSGEAVFLDVRSADQYATGHISGALSIPLTELETRITELDPGQWIITYCT